MKKRIIRTAAITLILLGALLIASPYFSRMVVEEVASQSEEVFEEITAEEIAQNEEIPAEFDYSKVSDLGVTQTLLSERKVEKKSIVGKISIPDVGINLSILKGVTDSNLLAGAATMREDQKMGVGNYPLAGHYSKGSNHLFGKLMTVTPGMKVKITDKKKIYEYEIYETKVVSDTSVSVIEDKLSQLRGKPIISLMTCYYSSKTGKRFFAFGELVQVYDYSSAGMK